MESIFTMESALNSTSCSSMLMKVLGEYTIDRAVKEIPFAGADWLWIETGSTRIIDAANNVRKISEVKIVTHHLCIFPEEVFTVDLVTDNQFQCDLFQQDSRYIRIIYPAVIGDCKNQFQQGYFTAKDIPCYPRNCRRNQNLNGNHSHIDGHTDNLVRFSGFSGLQEVAVF